MAILEKLQQINVKGRTIFLKRDCFGADGMSMNGEDIIFWNSITNKVDIMSHVREFAQHPYPSCVKLWVILWDEGAREPTIKEVSVDRQRKAVL